MENLLKSLEIHLWNVLLPVGRKHKSRKEAVPPPRSAPDAVRLEFLADLHQQEIEPVPIKEILSSANEKEILSIQPTVRVRTHQPSYSVYTGATVPTKTVKRSMKQAEAFMLLASSFFGLIIGILIAFFVK